MLYSIVNKNCDAFINAVKNFADLNQNKPQHKKSGGFPIFYDQNSKYYEQNFLEEIIENHIWFYLVNSILKELFEKKCAIKPVDISWPEMHRQLTTSFVDNIEKKYPFEFYINDSERIGYRYTDCIYREEQLDKIFNSHNIDKAVILDFSSETCSTFLFKQQFYGKYKEKISVVPFSVFFIEYFGELAFETYMRRVTDSIEKVYDYSGIESISNLSTQHLPYFVDDMLDEIMKISFDNIQYQIMQNLCDIPKKQSKKLNNPYNIITKQDYFVMNQSFFENRRYLAIAGKANYAKSFITSEYLYQTFKKSNVFDYTAIVSGYLKSVEQLLYDLMEFRLAHNRDADKLYIKKNSKIYPNFKDGQVIGKGINTCIKFKEENKEYFDVSFAPLVYFFYYDKYGWKISKGAKERITTYLLIYCAECRNEHLHKDNIDSIDEVEIIRSNTLLLFYYVLGGYKLLDDRFKDGEVLKVVDRRFDRMYRELLKKSTGYFYKIEFSNSTMFLVALPSKQKEIEYDKDGILIEKEIRFVKVEKVFKEDELRKVWSQIENDTTSDNVIYVTPESNITRLISVNTLTEEEKEILW